MAISNIPNHLIDGAKKTVSTLAEVPITAGEALQKGLSTGGEAVCRMSKIPAATVGNVVNTAKKVKKEIL